MCGLDMGNGLRGMLDIKGKRSESSCEEGGELIWMRAYGLVRLMYDGLDGTEVKYPV